MCRTDKVLTFALYGLAATLCVELGFIGGVSIERRYNTRQTAKVATQHQQKIELQKRQQGELTLVHEAYQTIQNNYFDPSKTGAQSLQRAAIEGMIGSLSDPWSTLIPAPESAQAQATPATPTNPAPTPEQQPKYPNPPITDRAKLLKKTRDSFIEWTLCAPDIAFLQIKDFGKVNVEIFIKELDAVAEEIAFSNASRIIVDLRYNRGGYINSAIAAAGLFLPRDSTITIIVDRNGVTLPRKNEGRHAHGMFYAWPTVVLVNEATASASEMFAAALRDSGNIPLIGGQTYGKGAITNDFDLSDNSKLKLVFETWRSPSGEYVAGRGLVPTYPVPPNEAMDTAVRIVSAMSLQP